MRLEWRCEGAHSGRKRLPAHQSRRRPQAGVFESARDGRISSTTSAAAAGPPRALKATRDAFGARSLRDRFVDATTKPPRAEAARREPHPGACKLDTTRYLELITAERDDAHRHAGSKGLLGGSLPAMRDHARRPLDYRVVGEKALDTRVRRRFERGRVMRGCCRYDRERLVCETGARVRPRVIWLPDRAHRQHAARSPWWPCHRGGRVAYTIEARTRRSTLERAPRPCGAHSQTRRSERAERHADDVEPACQAA
jgi:hypothetical protein